MNEERLPVAQMSDVAVARAVALRFARRHGLVERAAQEFAIIAGELASNLVKHAVGGVVHLEWRDGFVVVKSVDQANSGPVPRALRDARGEKPTIVDETGAVRDGLGCGFGAIRRLSDAVHVRRRADGSLEISASRRG